MNERLLTFLFILNLMITVGLGVFVFTQSYEKGGAQAVNPPTVGAPAEITVDLSSVDPPLTKVSRNLERLTSTIQRFNTSLVQYDFLKQEMERLALIEKTINVRARATAAQQTEENEAEVTETLDKLGGLSQKVKNEQLSRRQTMLKLISGLEQQLAGITNGQVVPPASNPSEVRSAQPQGENANPSGSNTGEPANVAGDEARTEKEGGEPE